jgi:hypothetical protein
MLYSDRTPLLFANFHPAGVSRWRASAEWRELARMDGPLIHDQIPLSVSHSMVADPALAGRGSRSDYSASLVCPGARALYGAAHESRNRHM